MNLRPPGLSELIPMVFYYGVNSLWLGDLQLNPCLVDRCLWFDKVLKNNANVIRLYYVLSWALISF